MPPDPVAIDQVVVVGIDALASLQDKPLIFWYPQIARALEVAADKGAAAVGVDLIPYHSLGEKLEDVVRDSASEGGEVLDNIGTELDRSIILAMMRASQKCQFFRVSTAILCHFISG